jgi:hypothetical protein
MEIWYNIYREVREMTVKDLSVKMEALIENG